jgi:hypothetical protein
MKGERRGNAIPADCKYTVLAGRKAMCHCWRLPCWGTVLFPLQNKRDITRPPVIRNGRATPRRAHGVKETSAPYFARQSDRRLWLGCSGAFNRCAHLPTVQRLIGIYTARNPRTFRHTSSGVVLHVPTLERLSMRAYTRQSRLRYGSQIANNGLRKKLSFPVTPK